MHATPQKPQLNNDKIDSINSFLYHDTLLHQSWELSNWGVGGSSPVYLEYRQHEKHRSVGDLIDTIRASSTPVKEQYRGLRTLHAIYDIVYIPHDFVLSEPTDEFNKMLKDVLGFEIKASFLGWKEIICKDQKKKTRVYVPQHDLKRIPSFSPIKKYLSRKNSVNRLVSQIKRIKEVDYVIHLVLTYPHGKVVSEKQVRKDLKKFIKRLEKELFNGDKLGGHYNIHPWSSQKPMERHPHPHVQLLNAVLGKNGKLIRFKPFFSAERLEKIKQIWKEISGARNLYVGYVAIEERAQLVHLYKYASRHVLVDFAYYYAKNPYNPKDREKIREMLEYENRRVAFGWCRKLKQFVDEGSEDEIDRCPICGGEAVIRDELLIEIPRSCLIVFFDWREREIKLYNPFL